MQQSLLESLLLFICSTIKLPGRDCLLASDFGFRKFEEGIRRSFPAVSTHCMCERASCSRAPRESPSTSLSETGRIVIRKRRLASRHPNTLELGCYLTVLCCAHWLTRLAPRRSAYHKLLLKVHQPTYLPPSALRRSFSSISRQKRTWLLYRIIHVTLTCLTLVLGIE